MAVDLVQELRDIERMSKDAQERIRQGAATTGAAMLRKIEERAQDAARWGERGATGERGQA